MAGIDFSQSEGWESRPMPWFVVKSLPLWGVGCIISPASSCHLWSELPFPQSEQAEQVMGLLGQKAVALGLCMLGAEWPRLLPVPAPQATVGAQVLEMPAGVVVAHADEGTGSRVLLFERMKFMY